MDILPYRATIVLSRSFVDLPVVQPIMAQASRTSSDSRMGTRRTIKISFSVMKSTRMTNGESHQRAEQISSDSPHGSATPDPRPYICPSAGSRYLKTYAATANTQGKGDDRICGYAQRSTSKHVEEEDSQVCD